MVSRTLTTIILFLVVAILVAFGIDRKFSPSPEQVGAFLLGVGTTVGFGFAWFRLNDWIGTATSPGRPQTIRLQTDDTPSQITWAAIRAIIKLGLVCLALVLVFLAVISNVLNIDLRTLL